MLGEMEGSRCLRSLYQSSECVVSMLGTPSETPMSSRALSAKGFAVGN